MLLACHLFIGALIGYILYRWKGDALAVPVAMVAAILPDLVDKPIGHLILEGSLDNGRIFAHSLMFLGIVVLVSVLLWRRRGTAIGIALLAGTSSHLMLDGMWDDPTTLLWPLLGAFSQESYPDYFGNAVVAELTAPSEYAFLLGTGLLLATMLRDDLGPLLGKIMETILRHRGLVYGTMLLITSLQFVALAVTLSEGRAGAQAETILAVVLLVGSIVLLRIDPGGGRADSPSARDV